ncbi:hypothetical protein [Streptomyces sp. NPDC056049]|uniref:hypothetical protein n=1 Tax=Streptomyces sp. NPDC056049 TaxID=3345693 RepID=UPI0035DC4A9E
MAGLLPHSVAGQVFLMQLLVVLVLVAATVALLVPQARRQAVDHALEKSLSVAVTFRDAPGTVAAMRSADPSALLQPSAERRAHAQGHGRRVRGRLRSCRR